MRPFYEQEISLEELGAALARLKERVYTKIKPLNAEFSPTAEPVTFAGRLSLPYRKIMPGEKWGGLFDCVWFHFTQAADAGCIGKKLVLFIDLNGEGCVYDKNGSAVRGLTNISSNFSPVLGMPGTAGKRVLQFKENSDAAETAYLYNAGGMLCADVNDFLKAETDGGAIVECVKRSEDGDGIVIRICRKKACVPRLHLELDFRISRFLILLRTKSRFRLSPLTA